MQTTVTFLNNGGKPEAVQTYVLNYLTKHNENENARFILVAYLSNGGKIDTVQTHILKYLEKNAEDKNAQFVLIAFLNNGGKPKTVQTHVQGYLDKNANDKNARFVLNAWLENGGNPGAIQTAESEKEEINTTQEASSPPSESIDEPPFEENRSLASDISVIRELLSANELDKVVEATSALIEDYDLDDSRRAFLSLSSSRN